MFKGQNAEMISKKSMGRSLPQCLHCKTRSLSQNISIRTAEAHYDEKINHKYRFFLWKWKSSSSWNTGVCVIVNWCVSSITVDHLIIAKQFPSPESVDLSIPQDIFRQIHLTLLDKYIQHSAKQNSFTALREWTSLPWGPSHDSTTCTSWSEAVPFLLCLLVVELLMCVSLRLCFYLYCCFMFVCSGKGVLFGKVGTAIPNVSAWVYVPVCDFLSVFVFV